uniref:ALMS_motif domain-containing protein n=1 Tax=Mesocestoides corti TaxID=53468 RepID=A0A5K3ES45_MESCO
TRIPVWCVGHSTIESPLEHEVSGELTSPVDSSEALSTVQQSKFLPNLTIPSTVVSKAISSFELPLENSKEIYIPMQQISKNDADECHPMNSFSVEDFHLCGTGNILKSTNKKKSNNRVPSKEAKLKNHPGSYCETTIEKSSQALDEAMSKELPFAPHLQTETNNLLHHQNSSSFTALPMAQSACLRQDPKCQATESSFTEVSCPLDAPPVEFEAAAFEANDPVRWKLLELVREELKQLKATKAAYVSKKQVIRQLRSLLEHFDSLPTLNELKSNTLSAKRTTAGCRPTSPRQCEPSESIHEFSSPQVKSHNSNPLTPFASPAPTSQTRWQSYPQFSPFSLPELNTNSRSCVAGTQALEPSKSLRTRNQPRTSGITAVVDNGSHQVLPLDQESFQRASNRRDLIKELDSVVKIGSMHPHLQEDWSHSFNFNTLPNKEFLPSVLEASNKKEMLHYRWKDHRNSVGCELNEATQKVAPKKIMKQLNSGRNLQSDVKKSHSAADGPSKYIMLDPAKTSTGGCTWLEPPPLSKSEGGPILLLQQHVPPTEDQASQSHNLRPRLDTIVQPSISCKNPSHVCVYEDDFCQYNRSNQKTTSLQEAFRLRMQPFITRSEARQRYIKLNAQERRIRAEYHKGRAPLNRNVLPPNEELQLRRNAPDPLPPCPLNALTSWNETQYGFGNGKPSIGRTNLKRKLVQPIQLQRLAQAQKIGHLQRNRMRMKNYSEASLQTTTVPLH